MNLLEITEAMTKVIDRTEHVKPRNVVLETCNGHPGKHQDTQRHPVRMTRGTLPVAQMCSVTVGGVQVR